MSLLYLLRGSGVMLLVMLCCVGNVLATESVLPKEVERALQRAKIPTSAVHVLVREVGAKQPLISHQANSRVNPASAMKLVTTLAGLELLGPAYRWKTEVYLGGPLQDGVLHGDLIFKGYGNPSLSIEQFWLWMDEIYQRGIRDIRGDIVLDRSFFQIPAHDPGAFDGEPTRVYNVGADALLLNYNAIHMRLIPESDQVRVMMQPRLADYPIENQVQLVPKGKTCRGKHIYNALIVNHGIRLTGRLAQRCGEVGDFFTLLSPDDYFLAVFKQMWHNLGGKLQGQLRRGLVPQGIQPFATHVSPYLSEAIRDVNKFSNNVMARQLFLSLSADDDQPATITGSRAKVQQWLVRSGLRFSELMIDNGSGLSRDAYISARLLADILQLGANSSLFAEFEASLPILGVDGTTRKRLRRSDAAGSSHFKTGTLRGVKAIAGYVNAQSGKKWILVFLINHPYAPGGGPAQDSLIQWLQRHH